jgi:DNA-binding MarR family transcriptional regulator
MEKNEESKSLMHYFLREKPVLMLVKLRNTNKPRYASLLAKEVDCTYSHTVRILQILEKNDLIKFVKKGRIKIIELTKLGERISAIMEELIRTFNKAND